MTDNHKKVVSHLLVLLLLLAFSVPAYAQNGEINMTATESNTILSQSGIGNDTATIMRAINGIRKTEREQPDSSLKLLQALHTRCLNLSFLNGVGKTNGEIGRVYMYTGNYKFAYKYLCKALLYPIFSNDEVHSLLNNLGIACENLGHYEQALLCYQKAITVTEKNNNDYSTAYTYMNIGGLLMKLGRYKQAVFYFDKLEAIGRSNKDSSMLAACLLNKSLVYEKMKEYDKAVASSEQCLHLGENDESMKCAAYTNLGEIYDVKKEFKTSLAYFSKAKELLHSLSPDAQLNYYQAVGFALLHAAQYKEAIDTFEQAQHISARLGIKDIQDIDMALADAYTGAGDYKKAALQYKAAISLKDSLQADSVQNNISENEVKFRTAEKDKELLEKQLALTRQQSLLREKNGWLISISVIALLLILLALNLYRTALHRRRSQKRDMEILKQQAVIGRLQASINAEDKERQRIGRDLHDGISGMLTAINLNIAGIQQRHADIAAMQELDEIITMLQSTAIEVRKTAHNLIPDYLLEHDLPDVLQSFAARINNTEQLHLATSCYGDLNDLDKGFVMLLYRIIQELVQNIIKHAHAANAEIQLRKHDDIISITVEDNGKGFDTDKTNEGIGLKQIRSRINALQGFVSVDSTPQQGTTIYIEFDLQKISKYF